MRSPKWLLVAWASTSFVALTILVSVVSVSQASAQNPEDQVSTNLERFGTLDRPVVSKALDPVDLAPDATVRVARVGEVDADWVPVTRSELLAYDAVKSVSVQFVGDETAFHIWLVEPRPAWLSPSQIAADLQQIVTAASTEDGELLAPEVMVGGRALADARAVAMFGGLIHWLAIFALLIAAALARWIDWRRAILMAVAFVGSVYFGSLVAQNTFGQFDGTVVTTPVLGAISGLAVSLVVAFRLVSWYLDRLVDDRVEAFGADSGTAETNANDSTDSADLISRSLLSIINDLILVLGAVVLIIGVLWIGGGLTRPLAAVVVGGLVGAVFSAAVIAPGFALLNEPHPLAAEGLVPSSLPDGRQLALLPVLGLVVISMILAAFMFRDPGVDLLDHRALDESEAAQVIGAHLGGGPGDPTDAVIATGSMEALESWAALAASKSDVAWVDTPSVRYTGSGAEAVDEIESLASPVHLGQRDTPFAVVVPSVPIRSAEGADLINDLAALTDGNIELSEGANSLNRGSTTLVVIAVLLLAIIGAGTVMVETENQGFAATSFFLRLFGGAATVGVYRLVAPDGSAGESLAALALISLLSGMFELEFLNQRLRGGKTSTATLGIAALSAGVFTSLAALAMSLFSMVGAWPTAGRFGLALAVGLLVEIVVGFMVLRPVLLGEDAVYHTLARPLRSGLHSGQQTKSGKPVSADDPHWRRLVTDLLIAEFGLQTDPEASDLDQVFLDGTPLYRQAAEQHQNLSSAQLRVTGLAPQLRKVETYREAPSGMLSVTVDHPERHLVDQAGTVHGVRRPERRSTMLWIVSPEPGQFRIAESIELGAILLDEQDPDAASNTFPEVASVLG